MELSPLVDLSDAKVIAIAQRVLSSSVEGKFNGITKDSIPKNVTGIFDATAKIGLVYGITSFYFNGLHERVKEDYENGVEKTQYTIHKRMSVKLLLFCNFWLTCYLLNSMPISEALLTVSVRGSGN